MSPEDRRRRGFQTSDGKTEKCTWLGRHKSLLLDHKHEAVRAGHLRRASSVSLHVCILSDGQRESLEDSER